MQKRERLRAFTLLELMVTLAVTGIILSFGVPGFMSFVANNRAATHTNDIVTALNLGRSEATRRGTAIELCASNNGTTCVGTWSSGWVLRTTDGQVLRSWPKRSGVGDEVVTANVTQLRFQARGSVTASASPVLFTIRLPKCTGEQVRVVEVGAAGRVAVKRTDCA